MRSVAYHQRIKRRNRHTILLISCTGFIVIFVIYTLAVVANGTIMAINEYNELKAQNRFEYVEYHQDEITRLLGGPDKDYVVAARASNQRDLASMERSLTRLLRMRRLMAVEDQEDDGRLKRAAKLCPVIGKLKSTIW